MDYHLRPWRIVTKETANIMENYASSFWDQLKSNAKEFEVIINLRHQLNHWLRKFDARMPLNVDLMDISLTLKVLQKQDMNRIDLKIVTPP
jgi:hypothetical protein